MDDGVLKALQARIDGLDWSFADKNSFATEADWEEFLTETGSELPISNDPTIEVDPKTGTLEKDLEELREQLQTIHQREKRLLRQLRSWFVRIRN